MKIFFNASVLGKQEHILAYNVIVGALEELGHQVLSRHVFERECDKSDGKIRKQQYHTYQSIVKTLHKADIMIVESSQPSILVGHLLTLSLYAGMPVLVLYTKNPHGLLMGISSNLLSFKEYSIENADYLKRTLKLWIKRSDEYLLKHRFNLMISSYHKKKIVSKASELKISVAEYIRRLIDSN